MNDNYDDYNEAGCARCGQRFYLPLDEDGQPIWTHQCPPTIDEKIDELRDMMREIKENYGQNHRA